MKCRSLSRQLTVVLALAVLLSSGCTPLPAEPPAATTPTPTSVASATLVPLPTTPAPTPVALPTASLLPTASATAPATEATTYTSAALGIRFSYLPEQNEQTIEVREQGDKIYVYPTRMEPTAGQWVQVLRKSPDESLPDAIARLIMPGHPAENCQVASVAPPAGSAQAPDFEYAQIVVPPLPGEDMEAMLPRWRTRPQPHTVVGGIGYFQADALHPDKFLFFSIGQYGILAGEDQPWQATIRFE